MCGLVNYAVKDRMRNRQQAIHLKGLAGREPHTGVVTNTRYEVSLGTCLDRAVRVAEVHRGGAVDRDRGRLCLKKVLHKTSVLRRPTKREYDPRTGRHGALAALFERTRKYPDSDLFSH